MSRSICSWLAFTTFVVFSFIADVGAQTVYKCKIGSELRFQQIPCPDSGPTVKEDLADRRRAAQEKLQKEAAERERLMQMKRAEAAAGDTQRKLEEDTFDREYKARLAQHCGGKEIDPLRLGLTEEQVVYCTMYQRPDTVNTTTTAAGVSKQYVYTRIGAYLYFRNGILTAIQQ